MTDLHKVLLISLIFLTMAVNAFGDEIKYARYPALSPDGKMIAFAFQGDIWQVAASGGEAQRLTIHEAEDIRPQYSPDGRFVLFSSRRFNNYDVFIIPAEGGAPFQLTFHTSDDFGTGWFPGGDSVLFSSRRDGYQDIFKVSIGGGMPIRLTGYVYQREYNGHISPDGRYLLFNNGSGISRWWRRDLRSSRNADIYLQDRNEENFSSVRLTEFKNHDVWPIADFDNNELYFVSCRGEYAQLWKKRLSGGEATALTSFTNDGVQWLNSNPQGNKLVFEQGFDIWLLDPATGSSQKVNIIINSDERANRTIHKSFKTNVDYFDLSPDDKKIVAAVHGELFVLPAEEPQEGRRITFTPARESYPVWDNESKTIYYVSDRDGNWEIYSVDVTTLVETRITETVANEAKPIISPDGKYLAYYRGLDKIIRYEISSGKETIWIEGVFYDLAVEPTIEYQWSHDSHWIIFSQAGPTYETDIFMANLEGGAYNISQFAGWNFRPKISTDGETAYFTSTMGGNYSTYAVELTREPTEFFESAIDSLFINNNEDEKSEKENEEKKGEAEIEALVLDTSRIVNRRSQPYKLDASSIYPVLSLDGEMYYFISSVLGKSEIWSASTGETPELTQLTHSGIDKLSLRLNFSGDKLYYLEKGKLKSLMLTDKKVTDLSFAAVMEIDNVLNFQQKFDETWQLLNSYFYDPAFHGADWAAMREKYKPLLEFVRGEQEFRNLIFEMMGELRASHLYIYSKAPSPHQNILSGETGFEIDFDLLEKEGRYRIKNVITNSPADLAGLKIGQYIISLAGQRLSPETNMYQLLRGTSEHRLTLTLSDKSNGKENEVELKPTNRADIFAQVYDDWVVGRRAVVDSLSDNRLGYLHIRKMYPGQLEKFKQELVSVAGDKEGLIIDVRNNTGGSTAVHLLGILVKSPYILRNFRSFPITSENKYRSKAFEKPMTLLINNISGSNSEIFAEGFRKLQLGKIIGTPTSGGVIGTSSYKLLDGTRIRRPSWGSYTTEMENTEIVSRQPDIFIENLPDDFLNGRDPQLVRAIEELMGEIK